jgi:Lon protease-like protein
VVLLRNSIGADILCRMASDVQIPSIVPVMTLTGTVFFPHVILPLYIFEARYRQMLADALNSNRLFAVACLDEVKAQAIGESSEPPCPIATLGVIRAAHRNKDGTSNLVLQGVSRIEIKNIVREEPYRLIEVVPVQSQSSVDAALLREWQAEVGSLLRSHASMTNDTPDEFIECLESIHDPGTFVDLLAYSVCTCPKTRQKLLETVDVTGRFQFFLRHLRKKASQCDLFVELQGCTREDEIERN